MSRKQLSICDLLQRREMGFLHRDEKQHLLNAALSLADKLLVHDNVVKTIPCIDDSSRSSYMADTNNLGIAAMTHTNRCISLINTGTMKRIGEINDLKRTVWTLCFHPYDLNLLATGNLGGNVCVFEKTKLIRSQSNENPITSISFHPKEPIIFYAVLNYIVIWNYEQDYKISELYTSEESRVKYVKFNPFTDMLITGIRREYAIKYFAISDEPDENDQSRLISCSSFFDHLMRSLSLLIDNIESSSFVKLESYWTYILEQTNLLYNMLKNRLKAQLQPNKFIGDFNSSLTIMQRRLHRIAEPVLKCDENSTDLVYETLKAIKYLLKLYKREVENVDDEFIDNSFGKLTDIIITIQKIISLDGFPDMVQYYEQPILNFQYRLQAWCMEKVDSNYLPDFSQDWRNLITYCYIHNDSTVEISKCGKLIATFRELENGKLMIAIHSLEPSTLGDHIYSHLLQNDEIIMSLSFSPSLEYLLVGIRSNEMFGYFLNIQNHRNRKCSNFDDQVIVLRRNRDTDSDGISYLKWSARSGDGIIIGYKTYQLRCLVRR